MLMPEKIRIAILGCGAGNRHLQTVLLHPDIELVASDFTGI
jgi:hypothetical protein